MFTPKCFIFFVHLIMCFHVAIKKSVVQLTKELALLTPTNLLWQPAVHINGFVHPQLPIVTQQLPHQLQLAQWGLVPSWVATTEAATALQALTLNAKAETVWDKPSFKESIANQRCLIPVTGFYEWLTYQKQKYPHYIYVKQTELFCLAGIYSTWLHPTTKQVVQSCSILTTTANATMERIHNTKKRMPVILHPTQYSSWLQPNITTELTVHLLQPYPDAEMGYHSIAQNFLAQSALQQTDNLLQEVAYPELAFL